MLVACPHCRVEFQSPPTMLEPIRFLYEVLYWLLCTVLRVAIPGLHCPGQSFQGPSGDWKSTLHYNGITIARHLLVVISVYLVILGAALHWQPGLSKSCRCPEGVRMGIGYGPLPSPTFPPRPPSQVSIWRLLAPDSRIACSGEPSPGGVFSR